MNENRTQSTEGSLTSRQAPDARAFRTTAWCPPFILTPDTFTVGSVPQLSTAAAAKINDKSDIRTRKNGWYTGT